jgi:hypothetical protein
MTTDRWQHDRLKHAAHRRTDGYSFLSLKRKELRIIIIIIIIIITTITTTTTANKKL